MITIRSTPSPMISPISQPGVGFSETEKFGDKLKRVWFFGFVALRIGNFEADELVTVVFVCVVLTFVVVVGVLGGV